MKTKYILTFELRYSTYDVETDQSNYHSKKYTIGEFDEFSQAVKTGNEFITSLRLDHPNTPGINGDRLGTPIFGNVKKDLVRNYLRNKDGKKIGEIFIKISTVKIVNIIEAFEICEQLKTPAIG